MIRKIFLAAMVMLSVCTQASSLGLSGVDDSWLVTCYYFDEDDNFTETTTRVNGDSFFLTYYQCEEVLGGVLTQTHNGL